MSGYGNNRWTCGKCGEVFEADGVVGDLRVKNWRREHLEEHRVAGTRYEIQLSGQFACGDDTVGFVLLDESVPVDALAKSRDFLLAPILFKNPGEDWKLARFQLIKRTLVDTRPQIQFRTEQTNTGG